MSDWDNTAISAVIGSTRTCLAAIPDADKCKEQPRTLRLESGAKARTDALHKAK